MDKDGNPTQEEMDFHGYTFYFNSNPGAAKLLSDKIVELEKKYGRMFVQVNWNRDDCSVHVSMVDDV